MAATTQDAGGRRRRLWGLLLVGVTVALLLLVAGPAKGAASGCSGSVTIADRTFTERNDTRADPIVVPDVEGLVAEWDGVTDDVITDHRGRLNLLLANGAVEIASWEGENAEQSRTADGDEPIDGLRDSLPFPLVGIYEIEVVHAGDGGSCTGSAMVELQGNPLTTPVGAGSAVGTLLAAIGVVAAGRGVA